MEIRVEFEYLSNTGFKTKIDILEANNTQEAVKRIINNYRNVRILNIAEHEFIPSKLDAKLNKI